MIKEHGAELAEDLRQRHETQDPKHSGKFVKPHPDFKDNKAMGILE